MGKELHEQGRTGWELDVTSGWICLSLPHLSVMMGELNQLQSLWKKEVNQPGLRRQEKVPARVRGSQTQGLSRRGGAERRDRGLSSQEKRELSYHEG